MNNTSRLVAVISLVLWTIIAYIVVIHLRSSIPHYEILPHRVTGLIIPSFWAVYVLGLLAAGKRLGLGDSKLTAIIAMVFVLYVLYEWIALYIVWEDYSTNRNRWIEYILERHY
ncbi:MAG: hypothetical protein LBE35_11510 [Clostridiales bacterium]|nr:hypothetical protein [Clostridiales bacterium]